MEFSTTLQPISAHYIFPVHKFELTFSQERDHTNTSANYDGTDIRCKIYCEYRSGKFVEEFEDEFPVQERHEQGDGVMEEQFVTKKWTNLWSDANPEGRDWRKPPIAPAPKLRDLCSRLLLQPTHVQIFHDGSKKRLLWLYGAVAGQAQAVAPTALAA